MKVVTPEEFDAWVDKEQQSEPTAEPPQPAATRRPPASSSSPTPAAAAATRWPTPSPTSAIGPVLDDLAADAEKYGKQDKQSPEEYVKTSIEDPGAFVVPNFDDGIMPADYRSSSPPRRSTRS